MHFIEWSKLTPEQQTRVKSRFCTNCLYKDCANCNPDKFPTPDGTHACECAPINLMFASCFYRGK